ncbi:MAG: sugar phosphate isomerase/epimerase family protein [Chloroflexota bacterium]
MIKLGVAIQTPEVPKRVPVALLEGSLEEKIHKAAQLGYDGVELITTDPTQVNPAHLKKELASRGLKVSAVASGGMAFAAGLTLLHSDPATASLANQRLYELIDLAWKVGAEIVTIGTFRGRSVGDKERSLEILADILRQAGVYAAEKNVRLALEPLNRFEADLIHTTAEGLDFLGRIDHPAVGLLIDSFHVNIEERSWTQPYLQAMQAGRLYYAHVGDNNRLAPGQGLIDFPAILQTLCQAGYDGWLSAELLAQPDADSAARLTAEYMRQSLKELACN